MNTRLGDIICFRDDKLFQGAVDISWFYRDRAKSQTAAASFVFHGPRYHGVRQQDGYHEHRLTDTASFAYNILTQACGKGDQPFTMAVAGYGTGKSHLALALAELLHDPESPTGRAVLDGITSADEDLGRECRFLINEQNKPSLVIALNGMSEFPLMSEIIRRVCATLRADGHDCSPIENVRPRFARAASLLEKLNEQLSAEICRAAGKTDLASLVVALREEQSETAYKAVAEYLINEGLSLDASQNGSLSELFQTLVENYCGTAKPYKNIVLLFDEFGKYLEFAIGKPYIAGSTALQELFEAIQGCSRDVTFVGFVQFELKAYLKRLNVEYRNEAQRYITRYENAEKVFLSTNLETLIANLIDKQDKTFIKNHISNISLNEIEATQFLLNQFFPASQNLATWQDKNIFTNVICEGCWPISPYALWFIYSLAAGSRFLQGRSALSLLKDVFSSLSNKSVEALPRFGIPATDLLTHSLLDELITSENSGNQGSVANAFESVLNRHHARLNETAISLLKAIVIAAKLVMKADSRDKAIQGLSLLSGLAPEIVQKELQDLQQELNIVEWDDSLYCFDILGDAIPKTQFISFLNQRRRNEYDDERVAKLFTGTIDNLTSFLSTVIETDFGEHYNIKTREWCLLPQKTNLFFFKPVLEDVVSAWTQHIGPDEAKGSVIYCYAGHDTVLEEVLNQLQKDLKSALALQNIQNAPVLIVLLHDSDNQLGTLLAEYDILQHLTQSEKDKFANLVSSHEESLRKKGEKLVHELVKQHYWLSSLQEQIPARLQIAGTRLFDAIYPKALPFAMDGFATNKGNGLATALQFARLLFQNRLTFDDVQSMVTKEKNRATAVFRDNWNIFSANGSIQKNPAPLQKIFRHWDAECREGLSVTDMFTALLRPPFGANTAAALLVLGVYFAARQSTLCVGSGEGMLTIQEWGKSLFSENKKRIPQNFFGTARLFLNEESSSQWSELLDTWEECTLYTELLDFPNRAKELKKRSPITSQEDMERYWELQQKSAQAQKQLLDFQKLERKAEGQFEEAERKGKIDFYIFSTANFGKLLATIEADPDCWPPAYRTQYEQQFGQMRQNLVAMLPQWFDALAPRAESLDAISEFKSRMEEFVKKLRAIKLPDYAEELQKRVQQSCRNIETIGKYHAAMHNIEAWILDKENIYSKQPYDLLRKILEQAQDNAKSLSIIARNKPLDGLTELRERLNTLQKNINARIKSLEQRLSDATSPSLHSMEELQAAQTELEQLTGIFSGPNANDLADLKHCLTSVQSTWSSLRTDLTLDSDMLAKRLDDFAEELKNQIEEKELMLDGDALCTILSTDIKAYREERSALWIAEAQKKCRQVLGLSAEAAASLLNWLRAAPVYLTTQDSNTLESLTLQVADHLSQQKIDWLIQEFSNLSRKEQIIFLNNIKSIMQH